MASSTTEAPISDSGIKSKRGSDTLESEATGLEIAVRIHGSQVTAVVLDTTEHVEPFEEDTSTMIVFPRGAVVKLQARVRTGHAVVLTNLKTKQTALCRIIQVNSTAGVAHYVKLEFSQPVPGFWGVHFPSDGNLPAHSPQQAQTIPAESEKPAESSAASDATVERTSSPPIPSQSRSGAPAFVAKPFTPALASPIPVTPPASTPVNYGIESAQREVVPLAAAPSKVIPIAQKPPNTILRQESLPSASAISSPESPVFDSLSTDEDVFGSEESAINSIERIVAGSDQREFKASMRSLEASALLEGENRKKRPSLLIVRSIAAAVLIVACGGWYVVQHRGVFTQRLKGVAQASGPAATARPASTQSPSAGNPSDSGVQTAKVNPANAHAEQPSPVESKLSGEEPSITITPVHGNANVALAGKSPASPPISSFYAGDLTARPKFSRPSRLAVAAPKIGAEQFAATGTGLGSLVGNSTTGLPAPPPAPKPALVKGGKLIEPRLIHSAPLSYPPVANTARVEGDVTIEALIDQKGRVASARAISGPVILRSAAVNSVRQWRYSPATLDGKPIAMHYTVTVRFRLSQ